MFEWYDPEFFGPISDWFGLIATLITIILTVRYYGKDNRKDFKFLMYSEQKETKADGGITYVSPLTNTIIQVFNDSNKPIYICIEGIQLREKMWKEVYYKFYPGEKKYVPVGSINLINVFLGEKIEFERIEAHELGKKYTYDTKELQEYLKLNFPEQGNPTYDIRFREIGGKLKLKPIIFRNDG
ncbi:hypothetical protein FPV24_01330 [Carnobacterium sp. PL24RED07]|uniref:hypothetical protein n=1 Tax=unclassified Carnobacterium TaxID=257487 RepID=UPI0011EF6BA2|nr:MULTISPECIES: hypothetical protein [unclassified Carnobacterium]KAF3303770.1 hypothetical protein FPV22_01330 [Carnobacterium sp. PL26RED25]KAF3307288.1 hypothetical protein FPV24_01330 [Carnobacterium sp. PL24RED07]